MNIVLLVGSILLGIVAVLLFRENRIAARLDKPVFSNVVVYTGAASMIDTAVAVFGITWTLEMNAVVTFARVFGIGVIACLLLVSILIWVYAQKERKHA